MWRDFLVAVIGSRGKWPRPVAAMLSCQAASTMVGRLNNDQFHLKK
jgi:hypothetical protein